MIKDHLLQARTLPFESEAIVLLVVGVVKVFPKSTVTYYFLIIQTKITIQMDLTLLIAPRILELLCLHILHAISEKWVISLNKALAETELVFFV